MPARVLECQQILPGTECTLLFLGSEADVIRAATDHASSVHGVSLSDEITATIREHLELLIIPGADQIYVGDANVQQVGEMTFINEPGYALSRFEGSSEHSLDESIVVTLDCRCRDGSGSCGVTVDSPSATCTGDCVRCAAVVTVPPPGVQPTLKMLEAF